MIYYPQVELRLDVPIKGDIKNGFIQLSPRAIEVRWVRNNHLEADECSVVLDWTEAGIDPRQLKNGNLSMAMWDANFEDFDSSKHVRFKGIVKKASRKVTNDRLIVDVTAHDYTTLFLHMKPFPERGVPEWTDTIKQAWAKICDHTGFYDPEVPNKCRSSVKELRDAIRFPEDFLARNPGAESTIIGHRVPKRFHAISKPPHKQDSDAWAVWQNIITSMGLMSYIDKDSVVVTDSVEHYSGNNPASLIFTQNILNLEESVDTNIANKGVLLQSFNSATGVLMESHYPPPGDERIKVSKSTAKKGRAPTDNETSKEYIPYMWHEVQDQQALDRKAMEVYMEISRQTLEGKVTTAEMRLPRAIDGSPSVDILSIPPGDAIRVVTPIGELDSIREMSKADRVRHLMYSLGYAESVALLIADNIDDDTVNTELFHVSGFEVEFKDGEFKVDVKYHNLIVEPESHEVPGIM